MNELTYLITGLKFGGAEKQLLLLAKQAISTGYKVTVIVLLHETDLEKEFRSIGADVINLGLNKINFLIILNRLRMIIKSKNVKLLHSHMFHAVMIARLVKIFSRDLKVISSAHCIDEGKGLRGKLYKITQHLSDYDTHVSNTALNEFLKSGAYVENNSIAVENAIEFKTALNEERKDFLSVGRLEYEKGFDVLIEAFKLVVNKYPEVKLTIIGQGSYKDELITLIQDLNLNKNIEILNPTVDVFSFYSRSKYYISSSRTESFGMTICEAIAMRCITLVPELPVIKEILSSNYPVDYIHDGTVESLTEKIIQCIENYDDNEKFIGDISDYVYNKFKVEKVFSTWVKLYARVMK